VGVTGIEWLVVVAGIGTIAALNWWFFFAEGGVATAAARGGVQEVTVEVRGGYSPATIRATPGQKLRLTFDRQETNPCSEEVVFPDFGVRRYLPAFKRTTIEIEPEKPGSYEFTCGMSMLRGRLIVEQP
jgi:plastocyanin domain-containing protein